MALIDKLTAIAEAIRSKTNTSEKLTLDEMPSAIEGIQSGEGGTEWVQYVYSMYQMFYRKALPQDTELKFTLQFIVNMESAFQTTSGVKKITLVGNDNGNSVKMANCFWGSTDLEVVDMTNFKCTLNSCSAMFRECKKLKCIYGELDFSSCTTTSNMFLSTATIEEIRFKKESLYVNLLCNGLSLLSGNSIQSIIDGLATVEETKTITFHADVKAKLTEAQISQITSKNWTLA